MAHTLSLLSVVFFVLAAIFLVLAIFFFVFFKIPAVISYLTGRNVRKSIAEMRLVNEKTGKKSYNTSKTNIDRGKTTGNIQEGSDKFEKPSEPRTVERKSELRKDRPRYQSVPESEPTELLDENATQLLDENATQLLDENATQLLDENATQLLDENATQLLDENATQLLNECETGLLTEESTALLEAEDSKPEKNSGGMEIIEEILMIHTDEVI